MLAWHTSGSIDAAHWLAYAVLAALVLAVVLFSGSAVSPGRWPLAAVGLLVGFALWTAISAAWSPVPSLARNDGLLALFYAVCLLTPLVTLRSAADRLAATVVVVLGLGGLAVWTAVWLRSMGDPEILYFDGRLDFPVTYWNGQAAFALIAFWPAVALAAARDVHVVIRALALASATTMACLWLGTQSKGGAVAFALSAIVVFATHLVEQTSTAELPAFAQRSSPAQDGSGPDPLLQYSQQAHPAFATHPLCDFVAHTFRACSRDHLRNYCRVVFRLLVNTSHVRKAPLRFSLYLFVKTWRQKKL
jgi:hypothetical protein